ncbi:MAG: peptidoglycan-binding protein [Clostridia bacterium]|nr:peptidoglycan-binding protein [Clostridia bacterium]
MTFEPTIPDVITVHLGAPAAEAENVTVTFPDYIKNVASSEIFPTWPESALRANIYAEISFALNRVYTEYYRSRGYDFDITNVTAYDQAFVKNRDFFDSIIRIVDQIFNDYLRRDNAIEPLFAQYCNGTTVTCNGLSQWGSVALANEGYIPYDILTNYYGNDLNIIQNAPVAINQPSYPGTALRPGDAGETVQQKQIQLNRISRNYPAIPKINPPNGIYLETTAEAVRTFQKVFGLAQTGIIDKATWYKISYLYTGVKRLSELDSEGIALEELPVQFTQTTGLGATGDSVRTIQYYLEVIALFYEAVPFTEISGTYTEETAEAARAFQQTFGLPVTGQVDLATWRELQNVYNGIVAVTPELEGGIVLFPGEILQVGSQGENVRLLQEYLAFIRETYTDIPPLYVDGVFGNRTLAAVKAYEKRFGLEQNGLVGAATWDSIARTYQDLQLGLNKRAGQFGGVLAYEEATE